MALSEYQNLVDRFVRAPGGQESVTVADRDAAIEAARLRYSQDCERILVEDVTWLELGQFGPLPAEWAEGSYLVDVEYPIGRQPISTISATFYATPDSAQLLTEDVILAVGTKVRVRFGAPHLLQGGDTPADTIPAAHREAVASYAASILCGQLAAQFSGERETSINADGSNTDSRSRNFAYRAKDYRAAYYAGIGKVDPRTEKAGSAAGTGDAAASVTAWPGRRRASVITGDGL
jgi:hypothetical protein